MVWGEVKKMKQDEEIMHRGVAGLNKNPFYSVFRLMLVVIYM